MRSEALAIDVLIVDVNASRGQRCDVRFAILPLLLLVGCRGSSPCPAAVPAATTSATTATPSHAAVSLGETFRLRSATLGEERVINVYLPPGYAESKTPLPVLYALDGGMQEDFPHVVGAIDVSIKNAVIQPLVVVGIANTERRRDLVAETTVDEEKKVAPHAGGTERFRRFVRDELKPEIARRYRVSERSAVAGESFAGLFIVETLLQDPDLFDTYIAIDPSVWWNRRALVKSAPERLGHWTAKGKRFFVATADYAETQEAVATLMAAIRDTAPAGLAATHEPFPAEHHSTIFPVAEVRAYRALFAAPAK
jgi:predicted alpha/beta superfamily hydrolase